MTDQPRRMTERQRAERDKRRAVSAVVALLLLSYVGMKVAVWAMGGGW